MFLSELREFPSAPCLAEKKNLMTARVSMLLKSLASLTCFRACFLPGRAKDLSALRYFNSSTSLAERRTPVITPASYSEGPRSESFLSCSSSVPRSSRKD